MGACVASCPMVNGRTLLRAGRALLREYAERRRGMATEGLWRADRAGGEAATAIGTYPVQVGVDAVAAEGALEGADHRVRSGRRQVLVAALAVGS